MAMQAALCVIFVSVMHAELKWHKCAETCMLRFSVLVALLTVLCTKKEITETHKPLPGTPGMGSWPYSTRMAEPMR